MLKTGLLKRIFRSCAHMHSLTRKNSQKVREVTIPVPWGKIAGKQWGGDHLPAIVCCHGYADNCNSFARLIPMLPSTFRYVSIDLPGHGHSSHIPPGLFYTEELYVYAIEETRRYLKAERIGLMGHSMGGGMIFLYMKGFTNRTNFLISFEVLDYPNTPLQRLHHMARRIDKIIDKEQEYVKGEPLRTKEQLMGGMLKGYGGYLDQTGVELLLARGASEIDGKLKLRRDVRAINNQVTGAGPDRVIHAPVPYQDVRFCLIEGIHGIRQYSAEKLRSAIESMCKHYGKVEFHAVPALHELQIMNAEELSTIITEFLGRVSTHNMT